MPVFDLVAIAKGIAKIAFYAGLIAFLLGMSSILGDIIISLWNIVSSSVDALDSALKGNGSGTGGAFSCFLYSMSELGINMAVSSFLLSVVGLGMLWAGAVAHIIMYRGVFMAKNLLVDLFK